MKVTNASNHQLTEVSRKKNEKPSSLDMRGTKDAATPTEISDSSEIALSSRAKDIKRATEIARNSSPDVDEVKVKKFQSLLDKGDYKVDSKNIADKLVDEHFLSALAGDEE